MRFYQCAPLNRNSCHLFLFYLKKRLLSLIYLLSLYILYKRKNVWKIYGYVVNFKTVNRLSFPCSSVGRASGCYRLAASGGDAGVKSGLSQGNRTVPVRRSIESFNYWMRRRRNGGNPELGPSRSECRDYTPAIPRGWRDSPTLRVIGVRS